MEQIKKSMPKALSYPSELVGVRFQVSAEGKIEGKTSHLKTETYLTPCSSTAARCQLPAASC